MSGPDFPVPLSAVALRLTDEVGQAVLDRLAAGDLAGAAELDQHVAAIRAEVALGRHDQPSAARIAGETAARAGWPQPARPYHARPRQAARGSAAAAPPAGTEPASSAPASTAPTSSASAAPGSTAPTSSASAGSEPAGTAPASAATATAACPD